MRARRFGTAIPMWLGEARGHRGGLTDASLQRRMAPAALQGSQVDIVNLVEPKIGSLIKNVPGVTIQNVAGRGPRSSPRDEGVNGR